MSNTNKMVQYHGTLGMFIQAGDQATDAAVIQARNAVGEQAWKGGFADPKEHPEGATAVGRGILAQAGVPMWASVVGRVAKILVGKTNHAGGQSDKLRVFLDKDEGPGIVISQDIKTEFAHKLLHKLEGVQPNDLVTIQAWGESVTKNGRTFGNHNCSVKTADGQEVPVQTQHFAIVANKGKEFVESVQKMGMCKTTKDQNAAKKQVLETYHLELAQALVTRFDAARQATKASA